ncbi:hypothetical protein H8M03_11270 [Sphingomonas sabuli]|uniref:PepSY domain-containing protein n=1 Tax=Sphingomonas sabuli TaxID=2764186 RepID=A0A7G9L1S1_9SPHN|nr:hypothetical protein [Sphingomonas sabuli]QNM82570.1 hypothetical protein H8M03_11270 [Sphingomonas sabuli]
MMKKMAVTILLLGATVGLSSAIAHPTGVAYETRGECERAAAASAKQDRERLVGAGIFPTVGAAQSTFHDDWRCEYDAEEDAWFIVDHRLD